MFYSRIHSWCTQRVSSLGLVTFLCLLCLALWPRHLAPALTDNGSIPSKVYSKTTPRDQVKSTNSQLVLAFYIIAAHVLGLTFPLRLCWSCWTLTKRLKAIAPQSSIAARRSPKQHRKLSDSGLNHEGYESSSSSASSSLSSEYQDGFMSEKAEDEDLVLHTIILPNYKEDMDTLKETLEVLASHPQAKSSYEICLAMEHGESGAQTKAALLIQQFAQHFYRIDFTLHPYGIAGEAQGKSSNLCWAARHLSGKYEFSSRKRNVIVTVIDSDSHLSERYFRDITDMHFQYPTTSDTTIYVPPIIFDRNAHLVPKLVRVADILWAGAGLSSHYQSSTICPPTSVYSLPLSLVDHAGGWDAGEEAIGEDLHMYIKCFFALNGNLTTRTVLSPASQSNVSTDGRGIRGFFKDVNVRYRQALRHMWGALDSGFVVKSVSEMWWKNCRMTTGARPHWMNTSVLLHRMYEAHFLPTHITLIIIASGLYTLLTLPALANPLLLQVFNIAGYLRLGSGLGFALFFFLYENYHQTCVKGREEEMLRVGLADRMYGSFSYRSVRKNCFDYCFFPIAGVAFGSVPTMVALLSHFWTLRLTYKVTKKPSWPALVSPL